MTNKTENVLWKLAAAGAVLVSLAIALIPTWAFLAIRSMLEPEGFWQQFVVYGVGIYFMGTVQVVCLIIWIMFWLHMWVGDKK